MWASEIFYYECIAWAITDWLIKNLFFKKMYKFSFLLMNLKYSYTSVTLMLFNKKILSPNYFKVYMNYLFIYTHFSLSLYLKNHNFLILFQWCDYDAFNHWPISVVSGCTHFCTITKRTRATTILKCVTMPRFICSH